MFFLFLSYREVFSTVDDQEYDSALFYICIHRWVFVHTFSLNAENEIHLVILEEGVVVVWVV